MGTSFIVVICIFILDQTVKWWVVTHIPLHQAQPLVPGLVEWFHIQNTGAGWGLFAGQMLLFQLVTLAMVLYIGRLIYLNRYRTGTLHLTLGLLLGGTLGNFADRLRLGYVVDMFHLQFFDFPVFNIADAALTVGVIGLILLVLTNKEMDGFI
ncbi:signal peptidase II [Vaginisenegalia massiliensis]|uniref:signal peptidase II n=1 Tax=Vaginisenegalia massiliensis TaxID=2058294 RepID=UPI000F521B55|nr:signal peptidase II [Vaginisenegalia massiliensis]